MLVNHSVVTVKAEQSVVVGAQVVIAYLLVELKQFVEHETADTVECYQTVV